MTKLLLDDAIQSTQLEKKNNPILSQIITAVSNFSVQYNFNSISIALIVMSESQCTLSSDECKDGNQSDWVTGTATAMVFLGAVTGQISMGYAGDVLGRNKAMTLTLSLVCISSFFSAVVPFGSPSNVYTIIIIFRFIMGIGLGGVYPLSATKAAEDGGDSHGNVNVTSASYAFFWQTPGAMTPWLLALIFSSTSLSTNLKWRLLLGLGAVPALIVVICSLWETRQQALREEEEFRSTGFTLNGQNERGLVNANKSTSSTLMGSEDEQLAGYGPESVMQMLLREPNVWRKLLATGGCWFIYDIAYYGVNLFGGEILKAISDSDDDSVSSDRSVRNVSQQQLIALGTGVPAIMLAIYMLSRIGTKMLQIIGFGFIAFCFVLLAALFYPLKENYQEALFSVYCFLLFSLSFGPNLTTFVLPAQTFSKKTRATFNGLSAAMGKMGAFLGVYIFGPVAEATSYPVVMAICAVISIVGVYMSFTYIDEKPSIDFESCPLQDASADGSNPIVESRYQQRDFHNKR